MPINEKRLFLTGTMRTGGSLVINLLALSRNLHVFNERLNFFRFCHGHYDLTDPADIERMLHHVRIRLKYRAGMEFDVDKVLSHLDRLERSPAGCFEACMQYFMEPTGKSIWGEYANLSWRYIPDFFEMFPNGKVVYVMRDLRGVLASFKALTFLPGDQFLNVIFNWIDGVSHAERARRTYPADKFMIIRLEDLHADPEPHVRELVAFAEEDFVPEMLLPEKWPELLDERTTKVNVSAHTKKKVYGFDPGRSTAWKDKLDPWMIAIAELLAGPLLKSAGYELTSENHGADDIREGLQRLSKDPFLAQNLQRFLSTGEGIDTYPIDPADPKNWSAPGDGFKKFTDTDAFQAYTAELEDVDRRFRERQAQRISS